MKNPLLFFMTICLLGCNKQEGEAFLQLNHIDEFPQEVIITQFSKNFVHRTDTLIFKKREDRQLKLKMDRPKYLYIQNNRETAQIFLKPGDLLKVTKENDQFIFDGDTMRENSFIQEIRNNRELKEKEWNYTLAFDDFTKQVVDYFEYKGQLLQQYLPEKDKNFFYRLIAMDDRAFKNLAILDYIDSRSPKIERDSLFSKFFDRDLLNFEKMEAYLDAGRLITFYSKKGVGFFMREKYGDTFDAIRTQNEHYILKGDIIAEYFDQPFKSILIYNDLRFYPEEYDFTPDSLNLTAPQEMLYRYKDDLSEEAYTLLQKKLDIYEKQKLVYAKGTVVPEFLLRDRSNQSYMLKPDSFNKLVLFDVWASWCGPCIQGFPKVRDLENQYSNDLEVVSISIDDKFDHYKNGLGKYAVPGNLKLYAERAFNSDLAKYFQITAIPRYILLDQYGKILDANINLSEIEDIIKTGS